MRSDNANSICHGRFGGGEGLRKKFESVSVGHATLAPRIPFGGLHLDTADVADHPLKALSLAQPQLELTLA